jgi:probable F420-dependent oxidoreductase
VTGKAVAPHAGTRLSLMLPTFLAEAPKSWDFLRAITVAADEAGIDRALVPDHVAFGERLDDYGRPELGGRSGGQQPTGPDGHYLEPLIVLSYLASITSRIRLGTNILLAALRRPVVLAKQAASLDALSGGRLELGVGVGWQRAEYEAAGLDFSERGGLLDHTLDVCLALWRHDSAEYHSSYLDFTGIHQMPKPVQPGGVPLWIGGTVHRRVVARVARAGLRWVPWGITADVATAEVRRMRQALDAAGAEGSQLQVRMPLPVKITDGVLDLDGACANARRLVTAGVTDLMLPPSLGWLAIGSDGVGPDYPSLDSVDVDAAAEWLRPLVTALRAV